MEFVHTWPQDQTTGTYLYLNDVLYMMEAGLRDLMHGYRAVDVCDAGV